MIETVVVRGAFALAWLARVAALDGGSPPIDGPLCAKAI